MLFKLFIYYTLGVRIKKKFKLSDFNHDIVSLLLSWAFYTQQSGLKVFHSGLSMFFIDGLSMFLIFKKKTLLV